MFEHKKEIKKLKIIKEKNRYDNTKTKTIEFTDGKKIKYKTKELFFHKRSAEWAIADIAEQKSISQEQQMKNGCRMT